MPSLGQIGGGGIIITSGERYRQQAFIDIATMLDPLRAGMRAPSSTVDGGSSMSCDEWTAHLYARAEQVDVIARSIHDRIAYELDSLGVTTP